MTHKELVERAVNWLGGSRKCEIVLSGISSTTEIPDAIGWSTSNKNWGSIVVECKVSVSDFMRDKRKKHEKRMGNYRWFLTPESLVTVEQVKEHYPDHGLVVSKGRRMLVLAQPEHRYDFDKDAEIHLLYRALTHTKDNLLMVGCSVNMALLTKSHFANWGKDHGVEIPLPRKGYSFTVGECR